MLCYMHTTCHIIAKKQRKVGLDTHETYSYKITIVRKWEPFFFPFDIQTTMLKMIQSRSMRYGFSFDCTPNINESIHCIGISQVKAILISGTVVSERL